MPKEKFTPKGGMCAKCTKKQDKCNKLPFGDMKVIERDKANDCNIVVCTEYTKE